MWKSLIETFSFEILFYTNCSNSKLLPKLHSGLNFTDHYECEREVLKTQQISYTEIFTDKHELEILKHESEVFSVKIG